MQLHFPTTTNEPENRRDTDESPRAGQPAEGRHRRVHEGGDRGRGEGEDDARRADVGHQPVRRRRRPRRHQGHGGMLRERLADQGDRARRQRHGQHRQGRRHQEGRGRDEHPRRQHRDDRRARRLDDDGPLPPDPAGDRLDEGGEVGKEQVHGHRDHRQGPRRRRPRRHRESRGGPSAGAQDGRGRLRSVRVEGGRGAPRRGDGDPSTSCTPGPTSSRTTRRSRRRRRGW